MKSHQVVVPVALALGVEVNEKAVLIRHSLTLIVNNISTIVGRVWTGLMSVYIMSCNGGE